MPWDPRFRKAAETSLTPPGKPIAGTVAGAEAFGLALEQALSATCTIAKPAPSIGRKP
jgi:hypothetical protein